MWALFNAEPTSSPSAFCIVAWRLPYSSAGQRPFRDPPRNPSFLVTLGMLLVVRGTALWLTDGFPQRNGRGRPAAAHLVGDFYIGGFAFT